MLRACRPFAVLAVFLLLTPMAATALPLAPGVYDLLNHRDGNAAPPVYGLRLDGLEDGDTNKIYTFDFEGFGADMKMDYAVTTLTLQGTMWGGLNQGSGYATGGTPADGEMWSVSMTYAMSAVLDGSGNQISVGTNAGLLTRLSDGAEFALESYGGPPSFLLGYGHRTPSNVLSGWGWVNHSGSPEHVYSSDWLFEVGAPVPEPSAAAVFGLGMLVVGRGLGRRKR